ncbi:MAG: 3-hydroxyacyl-CoA dehydrogenase family protein [Acidobacteria bacterium]|nr:3-hydroxyacyl-CoA dehydrogenase family protein [Acidobacteriota bacterium]
MKFERAVVIGTGMMGPGIAVTLARGGVAVTIVSRTAEGAAGGLKSALDQVQYLLDHGLIDQELAAAIQPRLSATHELDRVAAEADLVVESAPENMEFKQELFAHLDQTTRPDAVLASNTSGLSITKIAERCQHPERVVTTHFWNPPYLMPLVEIVKGTRTSDEVAQALRELLSRCGKVPVIVKKDRPGQLGNRLQMALVREAVYIVQEGIADVEDVDLAAKAGFGLRLPVYGIFEHMDIVGLDLGSAVVEYAAQDLYSEPRAPELMRELVRDGHLGVKTGQGFYDWSTKDASAVKSLRDRWLREFLKSPFAAQLQK